MSADSDIDTLVAASVREMEQRQDGASSLAKKAAPTRPQARAGATRTDGTSQAAGEAAGNPRTSAAARATAGATTTEIGKI